VERKRKKYRINYRRLPILYRIIAPITIIALIIGILLYTNRVRSEINTYNRNILRVYAKLWSLTYTRGVSGPELNIFFEEVIDKTDFPLVVTSREGNPIFMRNVDISLSDSSTVNKQQIRELIDELADQNSPVEVLIGRSSNVIGYIYFGESGFITWLRYSPLITLVLFIATIAIFYIGYNRLKKSEEQNIWLGMARETAHQLGTPISGLMGWTELLKEYFTNPIFKEVAEKTKRDPKKILDRMDTDIQNLNRIVVRFGQIGSSPEMEKCDVPQLVESILSYLIERMPHLGEQIEIIKQYEPVPPIMANKLLLSWALENLIKNSVESISGNGMIKVATRMDVEGHIVQIVVTDNGRGIPTRNVRKIFSPGFTTKRRGWGLGLSLAKRIVEEYHYGKLNLLESIPNDRTTFIIGFPPAQKQ